MPFILRFFPYEYAQRRTTMITEFTPSGPKAHIGASGSRFNAVHVCWYLLLWTSKRWKTELAGKKATQIFNPRGRGLNPGPPGWEAEIIPLRHTLACAQLTHLTTREKFSFRRHPKKYCHCSLQRTLRHKREWRVIAHSSCVVYCAHFVIIE